MPRTDNITASLATQALKVRHADLPSDVRRVARDCLADWLACTFAGASEPASTIVRDCLLEEGGAPQASVIGTDAKASIAQAALANGTASHALDYDDVNLALPGHVGVAVIPGLLALAEHRRSDTADFIAAFVAGYEAACRIGDLVEPAHYANGFHATATIGSLGAAVACAHLLKLTPEQTSHAIGVAATQAAGLKAMFGSMAKPLHAGQAAQAGLRAALLAQKGFTSRTDALECVQGFAHVHGADFEPRRALGQPAGGWHVRNNIFKFHAACFSTHSTIEAVSALRQEHSLAADDVARIHVLAGEGCVICNIQQPVTGLEAKFSLRAVAAFALLGIDTSMLQSWDRVNEAAVRRALDRVQVQLVPGKGLSESIVTLELAGGRSLQKEIDCGVPMVDKAQQSQRVAFKFRAITTPVIGDGRCARIQEMLADFEGGRPVTDLLHECRL